MVNSNIILLEPIISKQFEKRFQFIDFYLVILVFVATYCVVKLGALPNQDYVFNEDTNHVSILDPIVNLPMNGGFFKGLKYIFYLSAIFALIYRRSSLIYSIFTFLFIFIFAVVFRSSSSLHHNTHLTAQLLIYSTLFIWLMNFNAQTEIKAVNDIYRMGVISIICIFFFLAGVSKLTYSGFEWVNGYALQCWVSQWGTNTFFSKHILADARISALCQGIAISIELLCIIAVFSKKCRIIIGIFLSVMVAMFCFVFDYLFWHLIILVLFSFIPFFSKLKNITSIIGKRLYIKH